MKKLMTSLSVRRVAIENFEVMNSIPRRSFTRHLYFVEPSALGNASRVLAGVPQNNVVVHAE